MGTFFAQVNMEQCNTGMTPYFANKPGGTAKPKRTETCKFNLYPTVHIQYKSKTTDTGTKNLPSLATVAQ